MVEPIHSSGLSGEHVGNDELSNVDHAENDCRPASVVSDSPSLGIGSPNSGAHTLRQKPSLRPIRGGSPVQPSIVGARAPCHQLRPDQPALRVDGHGADKIEADRKKQFRTSLRAHELGRFPGARQLFERLHPARPLQPSSSEPRMWLCLLLCLFLLHFTRFCLSHPLFHFGQKFGGVLSEIFSPAGSSKCHNCNDQRDKGNDEIQNGHNACSFLLKYRRKAQLRQGRLLAHELNCNSLVAWYASASVVVTGSVTLI